MRNEFKLRYVVIMNDGVNEYEAEAGFRSFAEAIKYADRQASYREQCNPGDSLSVVLSAKVAHYEVVDTLQGIEELNTPYVTGSFYND